MPSGERGRQRTPWDIVGWLDGGLRRRASMEVVVGEFMKGPVVRGFKGNRGWCRRQRRRGAERGRSGRGVGRGWRGAGRGETQRGVRLKVRTGRAAVIHAGAGGSLGEWGSDRGTRFREGCARAGTAVRLWAGCLGVLEVGEGCGWGGILEEPARASTGLCRVVRRLQWGRGGRRGARRGVGDRRWRSA